MKESLKVGLVQASPVFNDLSASVDKAVALIKEAAADGVELVAFGECWLAGYPAWLDHYPNAALWDHEPTKQTYAEMRRNSIVIGDAHIASLADAAKAHQITLVIGANEKVEKGPGNGTLYNSLLFFDPVNGLVNHHRKLVPTFTERLVHGQGDGNGLRAVETAAGRTGGLICWEHFMPMARQALHNEGEQIHISVFPTVHEMHQVACRQFAFEGRSFVLAVGSILRSRDLPQDRSSVMLSPSDELILKGGSCIIGPDGSFIVKPVFEHETIVTAELDLTRIDQERMSLDVSGHYGRDDIFDFSVKRRERVTG